MLQLHAIYSKFNSLISRETPLIATSPAIDELLDYLEQESQDLQGIDNPREAITRKVLGADLPQAKWRSPLESWLGKIFLLAEGNQKNHIHLLDNLKEKIGFQNAFILLAKCYELAFFMSQNGGSSNHHAAFKNLFTDFLLKNADDYEQLDLNTLSFDLHTIDQNFLWDLTQQESDQQAWDKRKKMILIASTGAAIGIGILVAASWFFSSNPLSTTPSFTAIPSNDSNILNTLQNLVKDTPATVTTTTAGVNSVPEVITPITQVINSIPEVITPITKVVSSIPKVLSPISDQVVSVVQNMTPVVNTFNFTELPTIPSAIQNVTLPISVILPLISPPSLVPPSIPFTPLVNISKPTYPPYAFKKTSTQPFKIKTGKENLFSYNWTYLLTGGVVLSLGTGLISYVAFKSIKKNSAEIGFKKPETTPKKHRLIPKIIVKSPDSDTHKKKAKTPAAQSSKTPTTPIPAHKKNKTPSTTPEEQSSSTSSAKPEEDQGGWQTVTPRRLLQVADEKEREPQQVTPRGKQNQTMLQELLRTSETSSPQSPSPASLPLPSYSLSPDDGFTLNTPKTPPMRNQVTNPANSPNPLLTAIKARRQAFEYSPDSPYNSPSAGRMKHKPFQLSSNRFSPLRFEEKKAPVTIFDELSELAHAFETPDFTEKFAQFIKELQAGKVTIQSHVAALQLKTMQDNYSQQCTKYLGDFEHLDDLNFQSASHLSNNSKQHFIKVLNALEQLIHTNRTFQANIHAIVAKDKLGKPRQTQAQIAAEQSEKSFAAILNFLTEYPALHQQLQKKISKLKPPPVNPLGTFALTFPSIPSTIKGVPSTPSTPGSPWN